MCPRIIDDATRDAREAALLDSALALIEARGVSALTIDKLVARVPYSKGTVYNHFSCKEDLLIALSNQHLRNLSCLFRRAATFTGSSRERMLAIGYAYLLHSQLSPSEFMLVISAETATVREKASVRRQEEHLVLENSLLGTMLGVIDSAIGAGELSLPEHLSPQQVAFSLWAMGFGTIALLSQRLDCCNVRSEMILERELLNHCNIVLDGLSWTPLTTAADWAGSVATIKHQLFAEELVALHNRVGEKP